MSFINTGIFTEVDKDNKIYLPLAIREILNIKSGEKIDYYANLKDGVMIKKYEDLD